LADYIRLRGARALAIPASQRVRDDGYDGAISHKAVARSAGLGWIGESLLLITPAYGPRVRLGTVLTDLPLVAGAPQTKRCGACQACLAACPVKALLGIGPPDYPESRAAVFDLGACARRLKFFLNQPAVGQMVCGVWVQVCPWGKKAARRGHGSELGKSSMMADAAKELPGAGFEGPCYYFAAGTTMPLTRLRLVAPDR